MHRCPHAWSLPRAQRGPLLPRAHGGLSAEVGGQPGPQAQPEWMGPGAALPELWLPVWSLRPGQGCPQQRPACFAQMPQCVHRPETTASRSSTRRAANQASVSTGPLAHHLPGMTQRGGESSRSESRSPLEAHSPDWPQAHSPALAQMRPAAQLHCPTSLDPDGASPASPQLGGGPTTRAADARAAHRCPEDGVTCRAGGRKRGP